MSRGRSAVSAAAPAPGDRRPGAVHTRPARAVMEIVDVWAGNLAAAMDAIAAAAGTYRYVALDTEFPGVLARPVGAAASAPDARYQALRANVDMLRMIQLGITVSDEEGGRPARCWQFNFKFSKRTELFAVDSVELLEQSGMDLAAHERDGVDAMEFAELCITSGLVLNDEVGWVSFHGGYDFAYLMSVLTACPLPREERDFFVLLEAFFPALYDVKYLIGRVERPGLYGGLNRLAEHYSVERVGKAHQAGSDSYVTLRVFLSLLGDAFDGEIDDELEGILYGLGIASPTYPAAYEGSGEGGRGDGSKTAVIAAK
jgi:CCR4-NOT transcription complex subunit 7/8